MHDPWPHQQRAFDQFWEEYSPQRRSVLYSPTGGGKTHIIAMIIKECLKRGLKVALYTNRVMLTEQTSDRFDEEFIGHGIRAAGFGASFREWVQICSLFTEESRVYKKKTWDLHQADIVIVDEAHSQKGDLGIKIFTDHVKQGAALLLVTATPLGVWHLADHVIYAGTKQELRECGALLPCRTWAPDEPDMAGAKARANGDYTAKDIEARMGSPASVIGRVIPWWKKLNPDGRQTILFSPGRKESKYYADEFNKRGIAAAAIDGEVVYLKGKEYKSDRSAREDLLQSSKSGEIRVVCNRFVLREAIDMPWIYHGVLATVMGSPTSYHQSGGRVLRNHESMDHVIWQDHGGAYWRHGSLNDDIDFKVGDTEKSLVDRKKGDPKPRLCPKCRKPRREGGTCPHCGYTSRPTRMVVEIDGTLSERVDDDYDRVKRKEYSRAEEIQKAWAKAYFSSLKSAKTKGSRTMRQVASHFKRLTSGMEIRTTEMFDRNGAPLLKWLPHRRDSKSWDMPVKSFNSEYNARGGSSNAISDMQDQTQ